MRYLFCTILCLCHLLHFAADAQVLSSKGRFSVDYNRGCAPYNVTVTTLNTTQTNREFLLKYSSETVYHRQVDFMQPAVGNPQTFTVNKTDPEILLIQAITNNDGTVDRDTIILRSYTPVAPTFNVYGCSNNQAVAEISDRTYDFYEVYFGSNTPLRADASNNYTVNSASLPTGTNTVRVHGRYNNSQDNCGSSSTTVEVAPSLPKPAWRGLQWNVQAQTVNLEYTLDPQLKYQLERLNPATGNYELLFSLGRGSTDTTFSQTGLASQYYCYRIKALDVCNSNHAVSEEICTASWQVSAQEGYNEIVYQTSPSFTGSIQLLREGGALLDSSTNPSGTFREEGVVCRQQYCYQLSLVTQSTGGATAQSSSQCVVAQSSQPLPALRNISTTWRNNNQLIFYPDFPPFYQDLNLTLLDESNRRIAAARGDSLIYSSSPSPSCYYFTYASVCASQAAQPLRVCPLYLQNVTTEPDVFVPSWNEYTGYAEGVSHYELQELDGAGQVINQWNVGNSTSYSDFPVFTPADNGRRFRVVAFPTESGIPPSVSNVLTYELIMRGYFPNAFSPNGDGENDEFRILGKFVEQASLWIYNRWGEVLFHSKDKEVGWNGTFKGELLPSGPYIYKAEVITLDGKRSTLSGTIFLKR